MKRFVVLLAILFYAACAQANSPSIASLGAAPTITGTVTDWAEGDGIAPGEGEMQGVSALGNMDLQLGSGRVAADGTFSFTLAPGARAAGGGFSVAELFCAGVSASDPGVRVADVSGVLVPELVVAGQHGRPLSTISLLTGSPLKPEANFFFYYASADVTIGGACEKEYLGRVRYDLVLKAGWNSASLDYTSASITTQPLTEEVRWQLLNPLTW